MVPAGDVPLIKPLLLGADCVPTPRRLVFENVEAESIARLRRSRYSRQGRASTTSR